MLPRKVFRKQGQQLRDHIPSLLRRLRLRKRPSSDPSWHCTQSPLSLIKRYAKLCSPLLAAWQYQAARISTWEQRSHHTRGQASSWMTEGPKLT